MATTDMKNTQNQVEYVDNDMVKGFCEVSQDGLHRVFANKIPYTSFKNYFCYVKKSETNDYPEIKYGKFFTRRVPKPEALEQFKDKLSNVLDEKAIENVVGSDNMVHKIVGFQLFTDFCLSFEKVNCKGPYHPYNRTARGNSGEFNAGPDTAEYSFSVSNETNPDMTKNIRHFKAITKTGQIHYTFQGNAKSAKCDYKNLLEMTKTFVLVPITYKETDDEDVVTTKEDDIFYALNFDVNTNTVKFAPISAFFDRGLPGLRSYTTALAALCGRTIKYGLNGSTSANIVGYCLNETVHEKFNPEKKYEYISPELLPSKGNTKRLKASIVGTDGKVKKAATTPEQFESMKNPEYWQTTRFFMSYEQGGHVLPVSHGNQNYNWFKFTKQIRDGTSANPSSLSLFWKLLCKNYKEFNSMPIGKLHDIDDKTAGFVATVNISISSVGIMGATTISSAKCHFCSKSVFVLPDVPNFLGANEKADAPSFELKFGDTDFMPMEAGSVEIGKVNQTNKDETSDVEPEEE